MAYMPATSREYLYVRWGAEAAGLPVQIAIIPRTAPETEPADAAYQTAEWDGQTGYARLLIGAGTGMPLTAGEYVVWTRVTAGGQQPVRRSGILTVGEL